MGRHCGSLSEITGRPLFPLIYSLPGRSGRGGFLGPVKAGQALSRLRGMWNYGKMPRHISGSGRAIILQNFEHRLERPAQFTDYIKSWSAFIMKHYIGIDLGTTNSVICSYDGRDTRIWKSPEQNDVTPSAIFLDRRGRRYLGQRAYDNAHHNPDAAATLFKRLMGSSTPIELAAAGVTMTPEKCSAEILKLLFSYLPEEIRQDEERGTVVTVPAAFDQMQKEATLAASEMADLGLVALMQEPVAAVMTAMKYGQREGNFLIYDLGGGTLDLAVATNRGGRINLLANGGLAVCGGRDFDRVMVEKMLRPWLLENFDLPEDFMELPEYRALARMAGWAAEKAKIELSGREESVISVSEDEARLRDRGGEDIYMDLTVKRQAFNALIDERMEDTLAAAREVISRAGLDDRDINQVLFIGGPTQYKPLRDKICGGLGLTDDLQLNPMTAVAEGAAIFAESLDWSSKSRQRKSSRGQWNSGESDPLKLSYQARTPRSTAKVLINKPANHPGAEFIIDRTDGQWSSGRLKLSAETALDLPLLQNGESVFKMAVFDSESQPIVLPDNRLVITRTASVVESIPASHSVGVEVLESMGRKPVLDYLVKAGDPLPQKGRRVFKAAVSIEAGSSGSLNLKLWEGEIEDPITDNRPVGVLKISGRDFSTGLIPAGAELVCDYTVNDSGNIQLEVSVPAVGGNFNSEKNFYSRQEAQLDLRTSAGLITGEGWQLLQRINQIIEIIDDPRLSAAKHRLSRALDLKEGGHDLEAVREAQEIVLETRRLLSQVRRGNLRRIRQLELDDALFRFHSQAGEYADPSELESMNKRTAIAQRAVEQNGRDFEDHLDWIWRQRSRILWRQDWYVNDLFDHYVDLSDRAENLEKYNDLIQDGRGLQKEKRYSELRKVISDMDDLILPLPNELESHEVINIFKGARG